MDPTEPFYDLPLLLRLHDVVGAADPDGPPSLRALADGDAAARPIRLAFLAGSFNPLHAAHAALARSALDAVDLDRVLLVLSKRTVDKEQPAGLSLVDRLLLLHLYAAAHPRHGVALVNRGLYVEQAAIVRDAFPRLEELWVVVGFDKIVQILDPRYYADREEALDRLFGLASALVAPRAGADRHDLDRLLDLPENRRFRDRIRVLTVPPDLESVASSELRRQIEEAGAHFAGRDVPEPVGAFVAATGAYAPPLRLPDGEEIDTYGLRVALLETLARARRWAEREADFLRLLRLARGVGDAGRHFRAWLRQAPPGSTEADLRAFQVRAT